MQRLVRYDIVSSNPSPSIWPIRSIIEAGATGRPHDSHITTRPSLMVARPALTNAASTVPVTPMAPRSISGQAIVHWRQNVQREASKVSVTFDVS